MTEALSNQQSIVLAILGIAVFLWISELVPLFITSLFASILLIVFAGYKSDEVFKHYFDPVIVLFLGGFILARALQKYKLDDFIASRILYRFSGSASWFLFGIMLVTAFLSMWMSNTASAAVMIPIGIFVLKRNNLFSNDRPFAKSTVLAIAYSATIGGIGSLVGSPPNAIAARFLRDQNIVLGFNEWMLKTLPFVCLALVLTWFLIVVLHQVNKITVEIKKNNVKLNKPQIMVLLIFVLTVLGWLTSKITGLSSSTVAIFPILLLFSLRLLKETDLKEISWSTLLLFGGGLSLGSAITQVGLDQWVTQLIAPYLMQMSQPGLIIGIIFFGICITMIASNTASAAILIPMMLPLAKAIGFDMQSMAMLIAIGVSLDFMMPVGTPPSAIAYSTGIVKVKEMIKAGFFINLATGLLLALMYYIFYI